MYCADSSSYFEVSGGTQLDDTFEDRLACVKDFFKRCALFPLALFVKVLKTVWKGIGVCFGAGLVIVTLACCAGAREFFIERIVVFAKDLADWLLLPFAIVVRFFRLLLGVVVHPSLYFNTL